MLGEFKDDLVRTVEASVEVLSDDDALAILEICKRAVNREIAVAAEQYLTESICGDDEK